MNIKYYIAVTILFFATIYTIRPQPKNKIDIADIPALSTQVARAPASPVTPAARKVTPSPAITSANTAQTKNEVAEFLESTSTLKHLLRNDIPSLLEKATIVKIPDGPVFREETNPAHEYQYKEMNITSGTTVKKILSKEHTLSEAYYDSEKGHSFAREFHKTGSIRTLSMRWSKHEAIQLSFHPEGQMSEMIEAVDGKAITQKWDAQNNLIKHTTSGIVNGKFSEVNHLAKAPQDSEPEMDEFQDFDTTEL